MSFDQLTQGDAHLLLNGDWVVHMAADAEQFGARILVPSEAVEPACTSSHNGRADCHSLHIGYCRGAAIQASVCWEGRLQTGATGLALEALDETSFLTANVSASATVDDNVEVETTATCVLANKAFRVGLVNGTLKLDHLVPELSSHVDVGSLGAHGMTHDEGAFNELVWVVAQYFSVFTRAWL